MKDERIQATVKSIAAGGFLIWFALTLISLNYRLLILKQHPRQFWDFIVIFVIVILYVFIAYARKGAFDYNFKKFWSIIGIYVIIGNAILFFVIGQIKSIADGAMYLGGSLLGMGSVIAVAYLLNRYWKRKEGLEDEK